MIKTIPGIATACLLITAALPAKAGYVGECKALAEHMMKQPDFAQMKPAIDKQFGGDLGDFCVCSGNKVKSSPQGDVAAVADAMKAINDAYEDGATQDEVDAMLNKTGKSEYSGQFMMTAMACAGGG